MVLEMTWKPPTDIDENVRQWMKAKGWEVTGAKYDFDREVYAWRHEVSGAPSPTASWHTVTRATHFVRASRSTPGCGRPVAVGSTIPVASGLAALSADL